VINIFNSAFTESGGGKKKGRANNKKKTGL
jgi:hypothetical protein